MQSLLFFSLSRMIVSCKHLNSLKKCCQQWMPRIQSLAMKNVLRIGEPCIGTNYLLKAFVLLLDEFGNSWKNCKDQLTLEVDQVISSSLFINMDLIELAVKIYSLGNTNGNQKLFNKTLSTLYFILDELTDSNISKFAAEYPRYPSGGQLNLNENLRKFLSLLSCNSVCAADMTNTSNDGLGDFMRVN